MFQPNVVPSSTQKPSVGRIVHYRLTADDAERINRRRTTGPSIAERIKQALWPIGAQAHIGDEATEGDVLPLIVVRVHADERGASTWWVNGQVLLDGNDQLWVTSTPEGDGPGTWCWPPRA